VSKEKKKGKGVKVAGERKKKDKKEGKENKGSEGKDKPAVHAP